MNNQREIYEALLAGETIVDTDGFQVKFNSQGVVVFSISGNMYGGSFTIPEYWKIHKEPKWYENIPDGGVLCWCCVNEGCARQVRVIVEKGENGIYIDEYGNEWGLVKPLNKSEIQVFIDNAPEVTS